MPTDWCQITRTLLAAALGGTHDAQEVSGNCFLAFLVGVRESKFCWVTVACKDISLGDIN